MGVNVNGLRFLMNAHLSGVSFKRTATIGRQGLHMRASQFESVIRKEFGVLDGRDVAELYETGYADALLRELGADVVHSYDYSDYEGATHVRDLNQPLPREDLGQYSAVFDGGSLEHVFNLPVALKNCMELVEVGGTYLASTPANNYMGHGFYQFSPELYFRALSPANGYRVDALFIHEGRESDRWYRVPDPDAVRHRVELRNALPTLMLVVASRTHEAEIFRAPLLQSDYVRVWSDDELSARRDGLAALKRLLPPNLKERLKQAVFTNRMLPATFERVDPVNVRVKRAP